MPDQLHFSFSADEIPASGQATRAELTGFARQLVRHLQLPALAGRLEIVWNDRMRSGAGRTFWPAARIELNPRLLEISEPEVERTLRHELAHLVAFERSRSTRIAAHGAEWRQACAELGIPGEKATHRLPLPSRKLKRKWRYLCLSCGSKIDRVRRIKTRVACHKCCRQKNKGRFDSHFQLVERKLG